MYSIFQNIPSSSFAVLPFNSLETHQTLAVHGKSHGLPSQVMWRKQPEDVQHLGISVTPVVAQAQLGVGLDTQELNLRWRSGNPGHPKMYRSKVKMSKSPKSVDV